MDKILGDYVVKVADPSGGWLFAKVKDNDKGKLTGTWIKDRAKATRFSGTKLNVQARLDAVQAKCELAVVRLKKAPTGPMSDVAVIDE